MMPDVFKLSYPPNERNPLIISCLELRVNDEFGRHLVTTKGLKSGDIIAIEKAFFKSLDYRSYATRCANCFKSTSSNAVQCSSCNLVTFCSQNCERFAHDKFHKFECDVINEITEDDGFSMMIQRTLFSVLSIFGSLESLIKSCNDHQPMTVFDLNLNDPYLDRKLVLVCNSLESSKPTEIELMFAQSFVNFHRGVNKIWKTQFQKDFLIAFVAKFIGILNRNSFTMHWGESGDDATGCAIFPFASMFNHSCSPNVDRICFNDSLILVVKRPIEANEQLFICYQKLFYQTPSKERIKSIEKQFGFKCQCIACINNYPLRHDLKKFDQRFSEPPEQLETIKDALACFRSNCKYIDSNFEKYPCYEICRLMQNNFKILNNLTLDQTMS